MMNYLGVELTKLQQPATTKIFSDFYLVYKSYLGIYIKR